MLGSAVHTLMTGEDPLGRHALAWVEEQHTKQRTHQLLVVRAVLLVEQGSIRHCTTWDGAGGITTGAQRRSLRCAGEPLEVRVCAGAALRSGKQAPREKRWPVPPREARGESTQSRYRCSPDLSGGALRRDEGPRELLGGPAKHGEAKRRQASSQTHRGEEEARSAVSVQLPALRAEDWRSAQGMLSSAGCGSRTSRTYRAAA